MNRYKANNSNTANFFFVFLCSNGTISVAFPKFCSTEHIESYVLLGRQSKMPLNGTMFSTQLVQASLNNQVATPLENPLYSQVDRGTWEVQ